MNEPPGLEGKPSRSGVCPLVRLGHTSPPSPSEHSHSSECRQLTHPRLNNYSMSEQNSERNYPQQSYKKNQYLNESSESSNSENVSGIPYRAFPRKDCLNLSTIQFHANCWERDSYKSKGSKYLSSDTSQSKYLNMTPPSETTYLFDNFLNSGDQCSNLDHGYHTLLSPSPGFSPALWSDTQVFKLKKFDARNPFERLSDDLLVHIFSFLSSIELSICARVCRRFDVLSWTPSLWRTISLQGENISGDRAIRGVLRQLCGQGRTGACPNVEKVNITEGAKLTDRGLVLLARRCPELNRLQIQGSSAITNNGLHEITTRCHNLQHLDVSGCMQISCITSNGTSENSMRLQLQYLDLTDCSSLQDSDLRIIVRNCSQLAYLYLRRCIQVTDAGLKSIPSFCCGIRELSVSDCTHITDFGLYELAKLGATLRYLSVAKCDRVSDAGLKVIAKRCYKLRYLNVRGCEAVSDDAITILAKSCTRLRALDIGKCDVSDAGLRVLAESCPNLKKLSLRNCDLVTDKGVQCIAYYCRGLQQLNIQDCQISLEGYRAVKKFCKRCVIEHTNPGFF